MGDYSEYANRELRKPDGIANKIQFTRGYPGNIFLSFLLVEGEIDKNFYSTFIDEKCEIIIAYSKTSAIDVLTILEKDNFSGVLAIVDADFDVLEGKKPSTQNLLFTDTHDLETMVMRSLALEKVLREFGSEDKIVKFAEKYGKSIRTILIEQGIHIGYLRWVSLREGLALRFEELEFSKFVHRETLAVDVPKLVKAVKEHSYNADVDKSRKHTITVSDPQTSMEQLKSDKHDHWHVCCGHDLVHILSIGLCKAIGSCHAADVKPDVLERSLRLAFEHSHFQKTQLYSSIREWEKANNPFVVLSKE